MRREPTPVYVQPPLDPALDILNQQNQQQKFATVQDRVSSQSARLMMLYGSRLAGQTQSGGGVFSPLLPTAQQGGLSFTPSAPLGRTG